MVLRNPDQDPADILWPALNIGYEQIRGELAGGVTAWTAAGGQLRRIALVAPDRVDPGQVLDIRQDSEYRGGHLPGAAHVELGDLPACAAALPNDPTVLMCGHGERAMSAASLLERAGHTDLAVLRSGPADWARATGRDLVEGA